MGCAAETLAVIICGCVLGQPTLASRAPRPTQRFARELQEDFAPLKTRVVAILFASVPGRHIAPMPRAIIAIAARNAAKAARVVSSAAVPTRALFGTKGTAVETLAVWMAQVLHRSAAGKCAAQMDIHAMGSVPRPTRPISGWWGDKATGLPCCSVEPLWS